MTLPASGAISLNDIAVDLGRASGAQVNLKEGRFYLGNTPSVAIQSLYGKAQTDIGFEAWTALSDMLVDVTPDGVSVGNVHAEIIDSQGNVIVPLTVVKAPPHGNFLMSYPSLSGHELEVASDILFTVEHYPHGAIDIYIQAKMGTVYGSSTKTAAVTPTFVKLNFIDKFSGVLAPPTYRE